MSTVCCHGFGILEATGRQVRRPIIQGTICTWLVYRCVCQKRTSRTTLSRRGRWEQDFFCLLQGVFYLPDLNCMSDLSNTVACLAPWKCGNYVILFFVWDLCMCAFMQVLECRLVVDPRTRESRGFGFVTMSSTKEADRCIKYLHRSTLEGRVITVEKVSGTIQIMLVNWCCLHDFLPHKPVVLCFLSSTKVLIKFHWSLRHVGKG
jgi:hypothetical protein